MKLSKNANKVCSSLFIPQLERSVDSEGVAKEHGEAKNNKRGVHHGSNFTNENRDH